MCFIYQKILFINVIINNNYIMLIIISKKSSNLIMNKYKNTKQYLDKI